MCSSLKCLLYAFVLLFLQRVEAQEHSYEHFDVHDGLAGSTVYSMAQDKEGFIWFGTEAGLSRFDGTHFSNFTTQDGLPDNEILKVFVDSKNRIWLLPFKNEAAYYYKGKFHTAQNDTTLGKMKFDREVQSICEDSTGNICFASGHVLYILDTANRITAVLAPTIDNVKLSLLYCGLNKDLRFRINMSRSGSVMVADIYGDKLVPVKWLRGTITKTSLAYLVSPDLEVYEGKDSLIFFTPQDSSYFSIHLPSGLISLSRINDSVVILNTDANTLMFNIRQKKITDSFLNGRTVNSSFEDREGNIWFSTLGQGLYKIGSLATRNYFFGHQGENIPVFYMGKFGPALYFGSDHFILSRLDLQNSSHHPRSIPIYNATTRGRITSMVQLKSGKFLIGNDVGIFEMKEFGHSGVMQMLGLAVKSLSIINDSELLMTTNLGAGRLFSKNFSKGLHIYETRASCGYYDKESDSFYIGTLNGLYHNSCCDEKGSYIGTQFKELANRIIAIDKDMDGVLWVATEGEGVVGYVPGKPLIHITETEGLTSNICRSLFLSNHDIWVGTDRGLNKISFSENTWKVIPYTMADGLNSDMINAIYVQGSEVYAGTAAGVTYFDENKISKRSDCLLRVTGITVSSKKLSTDSVGFLLAHKNNNIKFDFVGISYKSAGNILYRYRLLGLDTGWTTTRETFLSYPSLPSGKYELQVIAINKFGLRSNEMRIPFEVDKLLWEKTWFRIVLVLMVALLVMLVFNYRIRLVRGKEAEKSATITKMAELEQMALRSQMNPHFIFNCLNSIQEYVLYKDVPGANEFITKFSTLIRKTLHISNQPFISLEEEIEYISTYLDLEKKRFENKFIYEIVIGEEVDQYRYVIPPMILQPYLENAIRHGIGLRPDKSGKISVRMSCSQETLICVVEDNGIGRKQAAKFKSINAINYQSFGMTLVEKRLAMFSRSGKQPVVITIDDLEDPSGAALGTRITLRFPLSIVSE